MPSSSDTLLGLLAGFAVVVKVTNHTGLCDAELAWYSPRAIRRICRGREGDEPHWTVWCWARLILSSGYSPDLPWSWRWRTKLDSVMPSSSDTLRELVTGFAEVMEVTNHTGLWDAELAWYSPSATHLKYQFFSWPCWITEILVIWWKFLEQSAYSIVINCIFTFLTTGLCPSSNSLSICSRVRRRCTFICAAFKSHTKWRNAQRVSTPTTIIPPTTADTLTAETVSDSYQNIAKLLSYFWCMWRKSSRCK